MITFVPDPPPQATLHDLTCPCGNTTDFSCQGLTATEHPPAEDTDALDRHLDTIITCLSCGRRVAERALTIHVGPWNRTAAPDPYRLASPTSMGR